MSDNKPDHFIKENGLSPVFGILLMLEITCIIAYVTSGFSGEVTHIGKSPFTITVQKSDDNQFFVKALNKSDNLPLSNVIISLNSYETDSLLEGPLLSDESGRVIFEVPNGYDRVNFVGYLSGIRTTYTFDSRSYGAQVSENIGPLGIAIIIFILTVIGAGLSKINWKVVLQIIRTALDRNTL